MEGGFFFWLFFVVVDVGFLLLLFCLVGFVVVWLGFVLFFVFSFCKAVL